MFYLGMIFGVACYGTVLGVLLCLSPGVRFSRLVKLAWRLRRQRNAETRRANQACADVVLKEYEVRRWKSASYTLGSMVDDHARAFEVMKNQLAKAELDGGQVENSERTLEGECMSSVLSDFEGSVYHKVRLRIRFRDRVLAGIPKNESVLDYFMNARQMSDAEKEQFKERMRAGELTPDEKDEMKETSWCEFERDSAGNLVIWHGNVKAMLREVFVTLGLTQKRPTAAPGKKKKEAGDEPVTDDPKNPSAGGRQTLQHGVHVDPLRIPFERNGVLITKPDGHVDKVKHISGPSGKHSALGRHDYVEQPEILVYLKWPKRGTFSEEEFKRALAVCQDDGLGACRSQGHGKFDVIEWTLLSGGK